MTDADADDLFTCVQWSPSDKDVFASCSVDGTIAIWDIRIGKSPATSIQAHKADVNVITWNRCSITPFDFQLSDLDFHYYLHHAVSFFY